MRSLLQAQVAMCHHIEFEDTLRAQRKTGIAHRPNAYRIPLCEVETFDDGVYGLDAESACWVKVQSQWFTEIPASESPELAQALRQRVPVSSLPPLEAYRDLDREYARS